MIDFMDLQRKRADLFNSSKREPVAYDCPRCLNRRGSMKVTDSGELIFIPCSCQSVLNSRAAMQDGGMDEQFLQGCTWDGWQIKRKWQQQALSLAQEYADEISSGGLSWFIISGTPGSGKTKLCTTIFMDIISRGGSGKFISWRSFSREAKGDVGDNASFNDIVKPVKEANVLYIDDFFKGNISPGDVHLAFEILNQRYTSKKPTIISSELTIDTIMRGDEAIASRMYEMSGKYYIDASKADNWRLDRR